MDRQTRLEQLRTVLEAAGCGDLMAAIIQDLRREAMPTPPPAAAPPPAPIVPDPPREDGGRPTALTDKLEARIVSFIRAGGTPRASAMAAGVPSATFEEWMSRGLGRHSQRVRTQRYAKFAAAITAASAEVRIACEVEVRRSMPLAWLRAAAKDVWVEQSHVTVSQTEPLEVRVVYADRDRAAPAAASSSGNGDRRRAPV